MQRIQQSAGHGYYFFVAGEVDKEQFQKLESKFDFNYDIKMSRQSKCRRKKKGEAIACLHSIDRGEKIWFVLMASDGVGRIHEREHLLDLRHKKTRLRSPDGQYELVHDGISWSWSMTKEYCRKFRERIHHIAALPPNRRRVIIINDLVTDASIERILEQLYTQPGFRLIRRQVGQLVTLVKREWQRLRPTNGPQPLPRTFLPYVRFIANQKLEAKSRDVRAEDAQFSREPAVASRHQAVCHLQSD